MRKLSLLCLLFCSCQTNIMDKCHVRNDPQRLREIEEEIYTPLEKQGLTRVYKGPQAYMNLDEKFWVTFRTNSLHFDSPEEAKPFFTKKIQQLLSSYNSNYKLRPFLSQHPIKSSELWITINFYQKDKTPAQPPELCRIELKNDLITYYRWDESKKAAVVVATEPFRKSSTD